MEEDGALRAEDCGEDRDGERVVERVEDFAVRSEGFRIGVFLLM